jgi:hypothetical protein
MIGEEYTGIMSGLLTKNGAPFEMPDSMVDGRDLFSVGDDLDYGHSAYRVTFVSVDTVKSVRIS